MMEPHYRDSRPLSGSNAFEYDKFPLLNQQRHKERFQRVSSDGVAALVGVEKEARLRQ
jgi:hypothetical protein